MRAPRQIREQHAEAVAFGGGSEPAESPEGPAAPASSRSSAPMVNTLPRVGRNDPCPCGSGKKYKKCHMLTDEGVESRT